MLRNKWESLRLWLLEQGAIGEEVQDPAQISRLDLSNRGLGELSESIFLLENLLVLNLSGNKLTTLPHAIKNLQKLTNLDIRRNRFERLPEDLAFLSLRSLNASANRIQEAHSVAKCTSLRVLDLSMNLLDEKALSFGTHDDLHSVNLSSNCIKDITPFLKALPHVERLNVSSNVLKSLPREIGYLQNLRELDLCDNAIESLDGALFSLPLQRLDIGANLLKNLHFFGCKKLEELILDENTLTSLSFADDFAPNLRRFSCESCNLRTFPLPPSRVLEYLCASYNHIPFLPPEIGMYAELVELDLEANEIETLPDALANLQKLKTLYIKSNRLQKSAKKVLSVLHPEICDIYMKSGIEIGAASEADIEQAARLLAVLFAIESDFSIDFTKQFKGLSLLLQEQHSDILVAKYGDEVVGMVTMQRLVSSAEGGYVGQLEDLVVKEEFRKMGLGSRLLNRIRALACEKGYKRLSLGADVANENALAFYTRRGFRRTKLNIYHYLS
ncbi:MAG: GNAT family N-acetyltransferase [Sulfurimonadaceae bacterium]